MGYFKDTLKGISWMGLLQVVTQGLALLKIAILARILLPSQFGTYGIALLVLGLLEVLTETGINIFLIQEKDKTEEYLDSAWVASILRGILITLIILIVSPFVVYFFSSPSSLPLLHLTAAVAFIRGLINPMVIHYQKSLQFKKEFTYKTSLYFCDFLATVIIAYFAKTEAAFIIGMLFAAVLEVISSFILFRSKPKFILDPVKFKKVINAGKWVTGAGALNYLFRNIDDIIVGKFLGTYSLGLYQQGYRISTLPVSEVSSIFNKVTFPIYVNIAGDVTRLKKAFWKVFWVVSGIAVPFAVIIFFFSRPLILIFLGENWLGVEPVIKILAVFGVFKALLDSSYSLFLSLKLQRIVMFAELAGIFGLLISIYPLIKNYGLVGVAWSTIVGIIFSIPVVTINLNKIFNEKI